MTKRNRKGRPTKARGAGANAVALESAPPVPRLAQLHPRRFFLETWRRMDAEAAEERRARAEAGKTAYDFRPLVVLSVGAVCLTLMEYFGGSTFLMKVLAELEDEPIRTVQHRMNHLVEYGQLYQFCWWSGWRVFGYFLVPALVTWMLGERLADQGLAVKGFGEHAWIYAFCFAMVLPCVIVVSFTDEFSTYYPFYKQANRSWFDFVSWELLYAAQFFSLEFFFRGFWLSACKRMMGSHAIFAMVVPYCMIHFGKPWLEALAAIVAGIVLGTLAMKTRSIWSGFLIHVSVAVSMDVAALLQTSALPTQAFPS